MSEWDWFETLPCEAQDEWNQMRAIVRAVARHGMDAFGGRAGGPWIWKCPECGQQIGGEVMRSDGNATTGTHSKTCPVPQAVDLVMRWTKEGGE